MTTEASPPCEPASLACACATFLEHARYLRGMSQNTLLAYAQDLQEARRFAGPEARVADLDAGFLDRYLRYLRDGRALQPASVRRRIAGLRALCRWLEAEGHIAVSPFRTLDLKLPMPKRLPRAIPRQEVARLIAGAGRLAGEMSTEARPQALAQRSRLHGLASGQRRAKTSGTPKTGRQQGETGDAEPAGAGGYAHGPKTAQPATGAPQGRDGLRPASAALRASATTALALRLMTATGVRVGELTAIRLQDVQPDGRAIRIHGKGSRERSVFVGNAALAGDLARLRAARWAAETAAAASAAHGTVATAAAAPLLLNRHGRALTPQALRLRLRRLCAAAGIAPHVTPHRFRHTAATCLIEEGVDIRLVQRLLGHSSIATTQIYTHVTDRSLIAALEAADPLGKLER